MPQLLSSAVTPPGSRRSLRAVVLALALTLVAASCGGADEDVAPGDDVRTGTSVRVTTTESASAGQATDEAADSTTADAASTESTADGDASDGEEADDADTTTSSTAEATTTADQAAASAPTWPESRYRLVEVASVEFPMALTWRPGNGDLWVAERDGRIRRITRTGTGAGADHSLVDGAVLDIADLVTTDGEGGLLGLTFSTDGGLLYVSYTDNRGDSVLAEYRMAGDIADPSSARILMQIEQPFSNHNGGQVERGPDGLLYWALGDGGSGGDPLDSGQDTSTLLGNILRLDPFNPSGEQAYGVPADNPFADGERGRPEIWLYGVRNPWRFSFDRDTDDLWIGDVGQNLVEEITFLPADGGLPGRGANLGWRLMEGDQPFDGGSPPAGHVGPIYTYGRDAGCSVTGGYVYRGSAIQALDGVYLFSDFCSGEIVGVDRLGDGSVLVGDVVTDRGVGSVVSFGEDAEGEVYVLGSGGSVSLLAPTG
ncbi:MAG: PQQ-dependent sugar dehydrogenase [Actinomycetota bacterium]